METVSPDDTYLSLVEDVEGIAEKEDVEPIELIKFCVDNEIRFDCGMPSCCPYKHKNVLEIVWENSNSLKEAADIMDCGSDTVSKYLDKYDIRERKTRGPHSDYASSRTLEGISPMGDKLAQVFGDDIYEIEDAEHYVYVIEGTKESGESAYYVGESKDIIQRLRRHINKDIDSNSISIKIEDVEIYPTAGENVAEKERLKFKKTILEKETTEVYGGK